MGILINKNTKVLVQGFTGKNGTFHSIQAINYGTNIVGGVTPGKGGTIHLDRPVFNTMEEAMKCTNANASVIYVPAPFVKDSVIEAINCGIKLIVIISEGVPILDMLIIKGYSKNKNVKIIGPNCPGIISPEECKIGIMPGYIHKKGKVGIISRSGTLTYEAVLQTTELGFGQSTCIGIGGDPIPGMTQIEALNILENDIETEAIILIGEIGGTSEEEAAEYIKHHITKKVVAYIAGITAPQGKRMGHAGAIVSNGKGTAEEKFLAFKMTGIPYTRYPTKIGKKLQEITGW